MFLIEIVAFLGNKLAMFRSAMNHQVFPLYLSTATCAENQVIMQVYPPCIRANDEFSVPDFQHAQQRFVDNYT